MLINKADLPEAVVDAALLAGLFTDAGNGQVEVNFDWFADPVKPGVPSLATLGTRLDRLVAIVNAHLKALDTNPPVSANGTWYAVPDPDSGASSPFCIVAPAAAPTSGQVGLGAEESITTGNLVLTFYAYVPLMTYSPSGAEFLVGSSTVPCQIGVLASTADKKGFSTQGVTFDAVDIAADIYLDPGVYEAAQLPPLFSMVFQNLQGTTKPNTYTTLASLLDPDVEDWIGEVIVQANTWLDTPIGDTGVGLGSVLIGAQFLSVDDNGNYQFDLSQLQGLTPLQIALRFLYGAMRALASDYPPCAVMELPGGGLYFISRVNGDGTTDYGFRFGVEVPLTTGSNDGNGKSTPEVDLCLGTWLTGEDAGNNWYERSVGTPSGPPVEPGIDVYLLRVDGGLNFSLAPSCTLMSVGLNVKGAPNAALLNLDGFTLNGAELRFSLDSESGWQFGGAAMLDGLGFPLGPGFGQAVQGSNTNPVAQSLVGSGGGSGGDQSPVNPAFSIAAGFVESKAFAVQLFDKNDVPATQVTIPIQRALGPLHLQSLGIGWAPDAANAANDQLSLLMSGSVAAGGLEIDLVGLSIGVPVGTPNDFSKYDLDLNGLGVLFSAGEVELSAALVKLPPDPKGTPARPYVQYDGEALIKAGTFAISAVGSYAYVPAGTSGYTSLFIFAVLDADLGGPEFFFVTGLAAGFGYNRSLTLPDQAGVPDFPLVAAASNPGALGATKTNGSWNMPDPATALAKLDQYVPPERGEYWLAAGVRFTSFDLINSTALLVVEFGNELEIALLGTSWISLPPPPAPGADAPTVRYAYGELGIEIKLLPSQGVFSATAILTPNSFVIDPACKLTGGFAFYVWFGSSPYAGQFVLTLGGYHPDFQPPSYFPTVPRLGFNWPVGGGLTVSGDAYFALTPSAVMAGAGLSIVYSAGNFKAWFVAQMDALIEWAPFHYELTIAISVGASYRVHIWFVSFTLTVELGAQLTLWGPPMGGKARINVYVFSVTVSFGSSPGSGPAPLNWIDDNGTGFAQTLLPHADTSSGTPRMMAMASAGTGTSAVQPASICVISVTAGLVSTFTSNQQTIWIVRPDAFVFSLATAIPTTEIDIASGTGGTTTVTPQSAGASAYVVCVRPMKATLTSSTLQVSMEADDEQQGFDLAAHFDYQPLLQSVPAAKWGTPLAAGADPEPNTTLGGRLMGLTGITAKPPVLTPSGNAALEIDISAAFTYDTVDDESPYTPSHLPLSTSAAPVGTPPELDAQILTDIQTTLMDDTVTSTRTAIFAALQTMNVDARTNGSVAVFAASPGAWLTGDPLAATVS